MSRSRRLERTHAQIECDLAGCLADISWGCSSCGGLYCARHLDPDGLCPACAAYTATSGASAERVG